MAATVEVQVNGTTDRSGRYLTWAPSPCQLRVIDAGGASAPIALNLRTKPGGGGRLVFRDQPSAPPAAQLSVNLDPAGQPTMLFVSGEFGAPSIDDGDAVLEVRQDTTTIASVPLMVRIRKDAETLTGAERDRFLRALAGLTAGGAGTYQKVRDCHVEDSLAEAHGEDGFWPWHRAYILDLERELQHIDPSVALPYWRFDKPAPHLFTPGFIGAPDPSGFPKLAANNPLRLWITDGVAGIIRPPRRLPSGEIIDVVTAGAPLAPEAVITSFTGKYGELRPPFEVNPHGFAHTSFGGSISDPATAPKDPLFFLLHCNVDRLWAKWQWIQRRFDATNTDSYPFVGSVDSPDHTRVGHNALDTMWPWNGVTGDGSVLHPRPHTAPIHPFPNAAPAPAPPPAPTVGEMIDFQGLADPARRMGFDYDDVPYQPST